MVVDLLLRLFGLLEYVMLLALPLAAIVAIVALCALAVTGAGAIRDGTRRCSRRHTTRR